MNHNQRQAFEEGWGLFDVDGRLALLKLDDPASVEPDLAFTQPKFASDAEAIIFVAVKAHEGSQFHRNAIDMIGRLT